MHALAQKSLQVCAFAFGFAALSSAQGANDPELPPELASAVRAAVLEEHFDAVWQAGAAEGGEPEGWLTPNRSLAMRAHFAGKGVAVQPMAGGETPWRWSARLARFGRQGSLQPLGPSSPAARGNVVSYEHDGLVEWYVNDERGLEQGFTLLEEPAQGSDAPLVLELALETELVGELCEGGTGALFRDACGEVALSYLGLAAWDADGRELDARVALREQSLSLVVDDRGASYPIVVDPLIAVSEVKLVPPSPGNFLFFGVRVALDGDTAAVATSTRIYVFARNGSAWVEQLFLQQGCTDLEIEGDTFVIGDGFSGLHGRVFVYKRSGSTWQLFKTIQNPVDPQQDAEEFGASVSLEGDRIAIWNHLDATVGGRPIHIYRYRPGLATYRREAFFGGVYSGALALRGDDFYAATGSGTLRHWRFDASTDEWLFQSDVFVASAPIAALDFASDDLVALGSSQDDTLGTDAGAVYVLERFNGAWKEAAKLYSDTPLAGNGFGSTVASRGGVVLVGDPLVDTVATNAGTVKVISRNGGWTGMGSLVASDTATDDEFGHALAATVTASTAEVRMLAGAPRADTGANQSGAAYVIELAHQDAQVYCTSKINSLGCIPRIAFSGTPSASSAAPFTISASSVVNQKNGVFLFGTAGRAATPFEGGILCVQLPKRMTGIGNSGGSTSTTDCSGTFSLDLNAQIQSGAFPTLVAGATVGGQFWYRDPGDPLGVGLTEAIGFEIQP